MELIGIIAFIALSIMFFYTMKNYKSPYDKEAYRRIQRVKNKKK